MLGVVAGTASFANNTTPNAPATKLVVTTDHKLNLTIASQEAKAVVILRDDNGHILYRDQVNLQQGYHQKFNLNELPTGSYQIAVTVGEKSTVKTFEVGLQPAQKFIKIGS